jgi:hypothetical protein
MFKFIIAMIATFAVAVFVVHRVGPQTMGQTAVVVPYVNFPMTWALALVLGVGFVFYRAVRAK